MNLEPLEPICGSENPFLQNARLVYREPNGNTLSKQGYGPRFDSPESRIVADDCEKKLVSQYLNAFVRAQLFLTAGRFDELCETPFTEPRPLRSCTASLEKSDLINPLVTSVTSAGIAYAVEAPEWITAPVQFQFYFAPGAATLFYSWQRKLVGDRVVYQLGTDVSARREDFKILPVVRIESQVK